MSCDSSHKPPMKLLAMCRGRRGSMAILHKVGSRRFRLQSWANVNWHRDAYTQTEHSLKTAKQAFVAECDDLDGDVVYASWEAPEKAKKRKRPRLRRPRGRSARHTLSALARARRR